MPDSISCDSDVQACLRDARMSRYAEEITKLADELYRSTGQGQDAPDINTGAGWNLVGIDRGSAVRLAADANGIADDPDADLSAQERDAFRDLAGAATGLARADSAASLLNVPFGGDYYERRVRENLISARVSAGEVQTFLESRDD